MNKSPVFLGVYSKITSAGDTSPESERRWHVWSLDGGQFLIQEIFPGQDAQGDSQRVDAGEFFNTYRVHAAFSSGIKGQNPARPEKDDEPAETATREAPAAAQAKEQAKAAKAAEPARRPETKPLRQSIFDELDEDDGLGESLGQAKAVLSEDELYYPLRPTTASNEDAPAKNATFYTSKAKGEPTRPMITDLEKIEEQLRSDFSLALIRLQTNRDKAIESLNKIVDNDANFRKEHKFMFSDFGTALRRRRLYSLAFRFHERAKELAPDDEHILFNMARAMFDAGKIDNARKYLQQAVAMAGDFQAGADFLEFIDGKYPSARARV